MCEPASMIATRERILWDEWTDSHSRILKLNGIPDNDIDPDFVKFEIVPPNNDYTISLDKWIYEEDQDHFPGWYNRENVEREARMELKKWADCHIIRKNKKIDLSEIVNPSLIIIGCNVVLSGQTGGSCRACAGGTVNSTGQTMGSCRACAEGTVNSTGQTGGDCWAERGGTVNSTGQTGGYCRARDGGTVNSTGQTGGVCWARDGGTVNRL